ncbi:unnamed protein product [Linum tenue]|uniref:Uncharacterized protein n=2 Tax=Linum tenue TaxID=586396 RepID=A0AAV0Q7A0_9ROSI|nr:unnamed protein product [Linum tenue]
MNSSVYRTRHLLEGLCSYMLV